MAIKKVVILIGLGLLISLFFLWMGSANFTCSQYYYEMDCVYAVPNDWTGKNYTCHCDGQELILTQTMIDIRVRGFVTSEDWILGF